MSSKTLTVVVIVVVIAGAIAAYLYYPMLMPQSSNQASQQNTPISQPDNTVAAGQIKAISPSKITIQKQDGTTALFTITATTLIKGAAANGGNATDKKISDLKTGMMVLITPDSTNESAAYSIVLVALPPPPMPTQ